MIAPVQPGRAPGSSTASKAASPPAASSDDEAHVAQTAAIAAQREAFDASIAEAAELHRELDALDTMLMAQLKDEDEVMKKWIAMIG